jgi:hypothetical protein
MLRKLFSFSWDKSRRKARSDDESESQFDNTFDTFVPPQKANGNGHDTPLGPNEFEDWMQQLPSEVRPYSLAARFEHIARKIAFMWNDETALFKYMGELLVDQRGGRQGFPPHVALELMRLNRHVNERYPSHGEFTQAGDGYTAQDWFAGRPPRGL